MERLYGYFENVQDGGSQSNYLYKFGTKDTQSGICFNLVLRWLQLYNLNHGGIAPNTIFREIMKQPEEITKIAKAQSAYHKENGNNIILSYIGRYGLAGNLEREDFFSPYDFEAIVRHCINNQWIQMLIIINFKNEKSKHAIGVIIHNNRIYMYDPNVGVMSVDNIDPNRNELLSKLPVIYGEIFSAILDSGTIYKIVSEI